MNTFKTGIGFFFMILSGMFLVLAVIILITMPSAGIPAVIADLTVMYFGAYLFIAGKRQADGRDEIKTGPCSSCSAQGPTRYLEFKECRAYLLMRRERSIEGYLCGPCAEKIYKTFTATNLKLGWWSLPGLIRNPMLLCFNHVNHRRAKALSEVNSIQSAGQAAARGGLN